MITCDINSESSLSEDEHILVSASNKRDLTQSSKRPATTPTGKPTTSSISEELLEMMPKLQATMAKRLKELWEEEIISITEFMAKVSATTYSNEASLKKIKSNLNSVTQTISKHDHQLNKEQEIFIEQ
eukprot:10598101-Ditylum_brightwellii.AAC.1